MNYYLYIVARNTVLKRLIQCFKHPLASDYVARLVGFYIPAKSSILWSFNIPEQKLLKCMIRHVHVVFVWGMLGGCGQSECWVRYVWV